MGKWGEGKKERGRRPPAEHGALYGAWTHDCKTMTRAKTKSWLLNLLNHPGTPENILFDEITGTRYKAKNNFEGITVSFSYIH